MNSFHVVGGLFAVWAVVTAFLGITRENWPGSAATERLVSVISVVLAVGAIGTAIYSAIHEEHETETDEAALVPR